MGEFVDPLWVRGIGWLMAAAIVALNIWLLVLQFSSTT